MTLRRRVQAVAADEDRPGLLARLFAPQEAREAKDRAPFAAAVSNVFPLAVRAPGLECCTRTPRWLRRLGADAAPNTKEVAQAGSRWFGEPG